MGGLMTAVDFLRCRAKLGLVLILLASRKGRGDIEVRFAVMTHRRQNRKDFIILERDLAVVSGSARGQDTDTQQHRSARKVHVPGKFTQFLTKAV